MSTIRLPAEWEEQDGILMAWPHENTPWKPYLEDAGKTIAEIAAQASRHQRVLMVTTAPALAERALLRANAAMDRIAFCPVATDDIWARDFGPITVIESGHPVLLDFQFNGWGGKHPYRLDNQASAGARSHGVFGKTHLRSIHFVLEGGSIESDGRGTILTTRSCLSHPTRNPHLSGSDIEMSLRQFLGANRILWLENGFLAGDDTDGHVDMLARFAPHDTIVHVSCEDTADEHFDALAAMADEMERFRTPEGKPYRLIPLPWPSAKFDAAGQRLPASYANFLVLNGAVLVPTYSDPNDAPALEAIGHAFPGRKIIGVDCSLLIRHHGSLHCVTMQMPKGVLP